MFTITTNIKSIEALQKHIDSINNVSKIFVNKGLQDYIKRKCLEVVRSVTAKRINLFSTSNEDLKTSYINNHKIRDLSNGTGFVIYNDLSIETKDYTFCVALAFEYGTGLVGLAQGIPNAWEYNINNNTVRYKDDENYAGWWLSKSKAGSTQVFGESKHGTAVITRGYEGMEIYRYSADEIRKNLNKWVNDYLKDRKEV